MTFYAVCNVNGPISVRLDGDTPEEALEYFHEAEQDDGLGRSWIDSSSMDAENDLGIDGAGMSEEEFGEALRAAGAVPVEDLEEVVNSYSGRQYHLAGGWYLWAGPDDD